MLRNYLTVALRGLLRNKLYSSITIAGLALGMACCLLIALYVRDEISYDRFHANSSRIYRVTRERMEQGDLRIQANTPPAMASALKKEFPSVQESTRFMAPYPSSALVKNGDRTFYEKGFLWADANVFSVFTFPLVQGNPQTALQEPFTVVITEAMAQKYFGAENPIGKTLTIQAWTTEEYKVTGVLKNLPANSHLQFDCLASFATAEKQLTRLFTNQEAIWLNNLVYTYILVNTPEAAQNLATQLPVFAKRNVGENAAKRGMHINFGLQALTDIHLDAEVKSLFEVNGDKKNVYVMGCIAVFIMLLACVNFINLSTARAARRAKEVGVRKTLGAGRARLVIQFLGESVLTSIIASALALLAAELALPFFNTLAGKTFTASSFGFLEAALLVAMALLVGFGAGAYPAFYLSSFAAATTLKGGSQKGNSRAVLRKVLVVGQFLIAIILIIGTIVMREQIHFMREQAPGFNKESVVIIPVREEETLNKISLLKTSLLAKPGILSLSAASGVPGNTMISDTWTIIPDGHEDRKQSPFTVLCDEDYAKVMGLELVAGRWLSKDFSTDAAEGFIINESAVPSFGFDSPEKALGKRIQCQQFQGKSGSIVGVVKDVHFMSFHTMVQPTLFHVVPGMFACAVVRIAAENTPATLQALQETWKQIAPGRPFDYSFLDETYQRQYAADERLESIIKVFTWLALAIASLGLFGLASFAAEARTKEIAVRKVLGASTLGITTLLGKEFFVLVGVSFLLACPLGYFVMNKWLQDFAYRITIGVDVLIIAGVAAFAAALTAILWQTLRAARANPVKALKYE